MHLSEHSLRQLDETYLDSLEEKALRALSVKLLDDLKEARDRLNQGPENSSRPPSSRVPWERKSGGGQTDEDVADGGFEPEPAEAPLAKPPPQKRNRPVKPANNPGRRGGVGPKDSTHMRNARTTRRSAPGVVGPWSQRAPSPIPAFRPWICTGGIRRSRG